MKFEWICLGTGCPVATPERMGSAYVVRADDTHILIDCGSGVSQRLVQASLSGSDIDALIITHYHSDHLVDFWQLIISSWHQGRTKPWAIYSTPQAIRHLQKQSEAYADEVALRIKHEHRPSTTGLTLEFHELSDKPILFGNLAITPFQVDHAPVIPAYGLVFEAYRKKLVFSGDTRPCSSLSHVLRQADILVQEVFIDREMQEIPGKRSAQTIQSVRSYHTTPHEAAGLAAEGKVDVLMLTHIVPPSANRTALVHEVAAHFSGPILIAEDLMRYDILNKIVVSGLTTLRL